MQRGDGPRVSVLVAVHNAAATITRALNSVLAQSFADFEVIVVNDGSTDDTARELAQYNGRLHVIEQQRSGQAAARNITAHRARGEYIAFLDADDLWTAAKLQRCVEVLDSDRNCALVYTDASVVDSDGAPVTTSLVQPQTAHAPSMNELLEQMWPILPSTVVLRREAFERTGGFVAELAGCEDIYFWLVAREQGEFRYLPDKLAVYTLDSYPTILKVLRRDLEGSGARLVRTLHQRYGRRAAGLVRNFSAHKASMLGRVGLLALRSHDLEYARACFVRAIAWDPMRAKNYLRLARTFLPDRLAQILGGRTAAGKGRAEVVEFPGDRWRAAS
jgi:glycosyltransferase involved in cell wall biosynthesis